nr:phosphoribosyl-ATP diphosphatase [uncultured Solibaculum sp.]
MQDVIKALYQVVLERKAQPQEGSYTCYLFEQGVDKILKKVGEESSEVIIAAKNGENNDTANEICDLLYHLLVLMAEQGISVEEVGAILEQRRQKIGNLKKFHQTDHNS